MPDWVADKAARLERIRAAAAILEGRYDGKAAATRCQNVHSMRLRRGDEIV